MVRVDFLAFHKLSTHCLLTNDCPPILALLYQLLDLPVVLSLEVSNLLWVIHLSSSNFFVSFESLLNELLDVYYFLEVDFYVLF